MEPKSHSKTSRLLYVVCERYLHPNRTLTFHLSYISHGDHDAEMSMRKGIIIGPWNVPDHIEPKEKNLSKVAAAVEEYGADPEKVFPPNVKSLLSLVHRLLTVDAHDPIFLLSSEVLDTQSENLCGCGDIQFSGPDSEQLENILFHLLDLGWEWRKLSEMCDNSETLDSLACSVGFDECNYLFSNCAFCRKSCEPHNHNFCGGCMDVVYCSRACAQEDWEHHNCIFPSEWLKSQERFWEVKRAKVQKKKKKKKKNHCSKIEGYRVGCE